MTSQSGLTLSQLVAHTAEELRRVKEQEPSPEDAVMQFTECEMELAVKITVEGSAGIKIYIVNVGAKGAREATHTVRLKFSAIGSNIIQAPIVDEEGAKPIVRQAPVQEED
jgi:hypothetical protein